MLSIADLYEDQDDELDDGNSSTITDLGDHDNLDTLRPLPRAAKQ